MIETTLCYIEAHGKYLMLHRTKKENDLNAGKWIGVGGKLEPGETPDQCLVREVREETGLVLADYRLRAKIEFISDVWEDELMYLYTATPETTEFADCEEGELAWVDKAEVMRLNLWEGDRIFLQELLTRGEEFALRLEYKGDKLIASELKTQKGQI